MDIAERIKKLREIYNITSNELAKITGIHPVSIRKYETNKMIPGIDVIDKMCEALKLPRMIFEGIPKQYTDYSFEGDFYQQLFLLIANGTLNIEGFYNGKEKERTYFSLNPDLAQYVQIKNGDEIIPLENITIHPTESKKYIRNTVQTLDTYIFFLKAAKDALENKRWSKKTKGETKEEYAERMYKHAEELQLKLMLKDHSWREHMAGINYDNEKHFEGLNQFILTGGDYYGYIMQADLPESVKEDYIGYYEDAYIREIITAQNPPYPGDSSSEDKNAWVNSINEQVEQYKIEHPDYKEQARKHAQENAKAAREEAAKK